MGQAVGKHSAVTVLLVEDSEDFQVMVSAALSRSGYAVVPVDNGVAALLYLRTHDLPALIIMDLRMPVMDGWAFREAQRQDERLREIPVVVYSNEPRVDRLAQRMHAAGFVSKTESLQRVVEEVRRCCH